MHPTGTALILTASLALALSVVGSQLVTCVASLCLPRPAFTSSILTTLIGVAAPSASVLLARPAHPWTGRARAARFSWCLATLSLALGFTGVATLMAGLDQGASLRNVLVFSGMSFFCIALGWADITGLLWAIYVGGVILMAPRGEPAALVAFFLEPTTDLPELTASAALCFAGLVTNAWRAPRRHVLG